MQSNSKLTHNSLLRCWENSVTWPNLIPQFHVPFVIQLLQKPLDKHCETAINHMNHLYHFHYEYYQQHKYHIPLTPPDSSLMFSRVVKGKSRGRLSETPMSSNAPREFGKEVMERGRCHWSLRHLGKRIGSVISFLLPITLRFHAFIEL